MSMSSLSRKGPRLTPRCLLMLSRNESAFRKSLNEQVFIRHSFVRHRPVVLRNEVRRLLS